MLLCFYQNTPYSTVVPTENVVIIILRLLQGYEV
jgi:hypothetical protein